MQAFEDRTPICCFRDYENRRQTYRNVIARQMQHRGGYGGLPLNVAAAAAAAAAAAVPGTSFDSVETDGDVSDTSRHDVTTTSFESTTTTTTTTTENTDSTGDGGTAVGQHKVGQMRVDSGYKSFDTQHSIGVPAPSSGGKNSPAEKTASSSSMTLVVDETRATTAAAATSRGASPTLAGIPESSTLSSSLQPLSKSDARSAASFNRLMPKAQLNQQKIYCTGSIRTTSASSSSSFDRRKSASKKRREYRTERHFMLVYNESFGSYGGPGDPENSDQPSGDSFDESSNTIGGSGKLKYPVVQQQLSAPGGFPRFLKNQHLKEPPIGVVIGNRQRFNHTSRDYSVDERTDALFNEFLRYDPKLDRHSCNPHRGFSGFHRWQRVHCSGGSTGSFQPEVSSLDGVVGSGRHRHLRIQSMSSSGGFRSGSETLCSSARPCFRRISPQDSIEEEIQTVSNAPDSDLQYDSSPCSSTMLSGNISFSEQVRSTAVDGNGGTGIGAGNVSGTVERFSHHNNIPTIRLPDDSVTA